MEPACGQGHISNVLLAHGYEVKSADLCDYGFGVTGVDYLTSDEVVDNVITNPPFKFGQRFVEHAVAHTRFKVAMLFRASFLESGKRWGLFNELPFARLWVFSNRVRMGTNKHPGGLGGAVSYAWFIWEHGYRGRPTVGWLRVSTAGWVVPGAQTVTE